MTEHFETFDRLGRPTGLVPRARVHRDGLWHKSAHVFLFDPHGRLWLQKRAADKDLYENLWDYSVGEHLLPGERYQQAALRGLEEELGVRGVVVEARGPLQASSFTLAREDLCDQEFQQAFIATYAGPIDADPVEVAEVRAVELTELGRWMQDTPQAFTPWFLRDFFVLGFAQNRPI